MRSRREKVPTVKLTLAIQPALVKLLKDEAKERGLTVSELVEEAIGARVILVRSKN